MPLDVHDDDAGGAQDLLAEPTQAPTLAGLASTSVRPMCIKLLARAAMISDASLRANAGSAVTSARFPKR